MKRSRTIAQQESRLAVGMLAPALIIVLSIIIFPVIINAWISVKPVRLGDLRPPGLLARRQVRVIEGSAAGAGAAEQQDVVRVRYILRNSSQSKPLEDVRVRDRIPRAERYVVVTLPDGFTYTEEDGGLSADLGTWGGGEAETFEVTLKARGEGRGEVALTEAEIREWEDRPLENSFRSENVLTSLRLTGENYRQILSSGGFFTELANTIIYTLGGASGAILFGLLAALLVNGAFVGRGVLRVLLLFPYVAPIIAVAFTWQFLLDPLNGFVNALLGKFGIIENNISFLSQRPTAMISVILFDAWRYSPFAYLFILARLQAIPKELYESATVDGAGVMRTFWSITLPQLSGILGTIFLLRFIWTFNRFDDIFLLTGGAGGTKTLPIAVYDNAIGQRDIGRGSATAVLLFCMLAIFLVIYVRFIDRKAQENDE